MKFEINGKDLKQALKKLSLIDDKIIKAIKIEASDHVSMYATDTTSTMSIYVPASILTPGTICVKSQQLFQLAKFLKDQTVTFNDNIITLNDSRFEIEIPTHDDFPEIRTTPSNTPNVKLNGSTLITLLEHVNLVNSKTKVAILKYVHLDTKISISTDGNKLQVVAADVYRLLLKQHEINAEPFNVVLDKKAAKYLMRLIKKDQPVEISVTQDNLLNNQDIWFISTDWSLVSFDFASCEAFPNCKSIKAVLDFAGFEYEINKEKLKAALQYVHPFTKEPNYDVTLEFKDNALNIIAGHDTTKGVILSIPVKTKHETTISLDSRYVLDAMKILDNSESIKIKVEKDLVRDLVRSRKIEFSSDDSCRYVIAALKY